MSRRRVKPDELDLWNQVARTTERLSPPKRAPALEVPTQKKVKRKPTPKPIEPFTLGAVPTQTREVHDVLPALSERLRKAPVKMDAKSYKGMQRGKLKPEGRNDLHGMTVAQAHTALISFILSSQRADVFFGTGDDAGRQAGRLRDPGRMVVLMPIQRAYAYLPENVQ